MSASGVLDNARRPLTWAKIRFLFSIPRERSVFTAKIFCLTSYTGYGCPYRIKSFVSSAFFAVRKIKNECPQSANHAAHPSFSLESRLYFLNAKTLRRKGAKRKRTLRLGDLASLRSKTKRRRQVGRWSIWRHADIHKSRCFCGSFFRHDTPRRGVPRHGHRVTTDGHAKALGIYPDLSGGSWGCLWVNYRKGKKKL